MNKRIKQLAEQSMVLDYSTWDSYNQKTVEHYKFDKEKFAELLIQVYAEELRQLNDGERVVIPKDREHAQAMVRVGMHYLEQNNVLS